MIVVGDCICCCRCVVTSVIVVLHGALGWSLGGVRLEQRVVHVEKTSKLIVRAFDSRLDRFQWVLNLRSVTTTMLLSNQISTTFCA